MIFIASDHAGYDLKSTIISHFGKSHAILDLGTNNINSVDYPDFAYFIAQSIQYNNDDENNINSIVDDMNIYQKNPKSFGILICGSGIGMSIAANRFSWIRAALCFCPEQAMLARQHNNANVLVLAQKFTEQSTAILITETFIHTSYDSMEKRHARRVAKMS